MRIGRLSRLFSPAYGQCSRCHTTWRFVREHLTLYASGSGCFALCERCWIDLTPAERVPFYRAVHGTRDAWARIETAVLAGL